MSGPTAPESVTLTVLPAGTRVSARPGTLLRDILFEHGAEFPCGGQGRCRGCRVRVRFGSAQVDPVQAERLSAAELADGWRLACQVRLHDDLTVELRQWDAAILAGDASFEFTPQEGAGVAVDLGTTTVVAQLLDLRTGQVLAVRTALNPQARYGADVMSRIQHAIAPGGAGELTSCIRRLVGALAHQLLGAARLPATELRRVVLVGNTAMHHLFCGIDIEALSHAPFEPVEDGLQQLTVQELGWPLCGEPSVEFLRCLGGFVGSDLLAGILAVGLRTRERPALLVDLGTNGEIVLGGREGVLCASTAAGPAFEGAGIGMGMRAASGAVWKVRQCGSEIVCDVLGGAAPVGICGSGLVDAVAVGLDTGRIQPSGRLADRGQRWALAPPVQITQADIRQLQLAKGAIAAGIDLLLREWGITAADVAKVYLAGAFGNYVDRGSARRIGLIDFPAEIVEPAGNTALQGAKLALFTPPAEDRTFAELRALVSHRALNADATFHETFAAHMGFPEAA